MKFRSSESLRWSRLSKAEAFSDHWPATWGVRRVLAVSANPTFLRDVVRSVLLVISTVLEFDRSWQSGEIPDDQKNGNTLPMFASVFNMDDGPRVSQHPELEDHDCENDQLPLDPDIVQDLLLQIDPYRSVGPVGINPRILKELANVITKPFLMIFEMYWESAKWKLVNVVPVF
ncbi:hypothetical protein BTVI_62537 [Pitangus sulphuratus]|nr:hypothetical protein BTVI_62537 [Pitangus sulphuratus]